MLCLSHVKPRIAGVRSSRSSCLDGRREGGQALRFFCTASQPFHFRPPGGVNKGFRQHLLYTSSNED